MSSTSTSGRLRKAICAKIDDRLIALQFSEAARSRLVKEKE